jgi:flagellar biosynthetic protein FliO
LHTYLLLGTLLAVQGTPGVPDGTEPPPSFGWEALQMLLALGLVCVLAWVALNWGMRRLMRMTPGKGMVKVHERTAIEPRKALYVVEVAEQFYLVGAAESGMNLIATLDNDRARAAVSAKAAAGAVRTRGFAEALRKAVGVNKEPPK